MVEFRHDHRYEHQLSWGGAMWTRVAAIIIMFTAWATSAVGQGTERAFDCSAIQGRLSRDFYEHNRPQVDRFDDTEEWSRAAPADENIDETLLRRAAERLDASREFKPLSLIVVRNNKLVFEQYFNGATPSSSTNAHSASKSMWGALVGIAIHEGIIPGLDTTLLALLPQRYSALLDARKRRITIRHLITMSSGLSWVEDKTEYEVERHRDRVAAILSLQSVAEPGTRFNYSTGDAHLVSAAMTEALKLSGRSGSLCDYAHAKLLAPIGVVAERWLRDPQGYFAGGFGIYMTARELAKFGMLYANGGKWKSKWVVPQQWVEHSLAPQIQARAKDSKVPSAYGYDFWLGKLGERRLAFAWGHGGQMIYIIRELNLVVVMTANTYRTDPDEQEVAKTYEAILRECIIPALDTSRRPQCTS